eukprot:g5410.t1
MTRITHKSCIELNRLIHSKTGNMASKRNGSYAKRKSLMSDVGSKKTKKRKSDDLFPAEEVLDRLDEDDMKEILKSLLHSGGVTGKKTKELLMKKKKEMDEKPVDLAYYGSEAHRRIHQLDHLRPSQQFTRAFEVKRDLEDLVEEASRHSPEKAVMALARIGGVLSHAPDTGEVFKRIAGCGGIQEDIVDSIKIALKSVTSWDVLEDAYAQLGRVHYRLDQYGIEEFEECLDIMSKHFEEEEESD